MRLIDWDEHRADREQVVADQGQWLGLVDENLIPFMDLPQPSAMDWPEARGVIESVSITLRVRTPSGRPHAVVSELVAENLGRVDSVGRLVPVTGPTRLVSMQRRGRRVQTMLVTHVVAEGDALSPHTLTIHGVGLLGYLDLLPCPSNPLSWTSEFTRFDRDWVGDPEEQELFETPRDLSSCTMITAADGATVEGLADDVIHRIIAESIDAVHRVAGITEDPPYAAVRYARQDVSPRMMLRPTDQTIWQEIAEPALSAGISITAHLWWPGDPQPPQVTLAAPTILFSVKQEVSHAGSDQ